MAKSLPTPVADTIRELQNVGRFLDRIAETTVIDHVYMHQLARAHASAVFNAIARVEALAGLVDELADLHERRTERLNALASTLFPGNETEH